VIHFVLSLDGITEATQYLCALVTIRNQRTDTWTTRLISNFFNRYDERARIYPTGSLG